MGLLIAMDYKPCVKRLKAKSANNENHTQKTKTVKRCQAPNYGNAVVPLRFTNGVGFPILLSNLSGRANQYLKFTSGEFALILFAKHKGGNLVHTPVGGEGESPPSAAGQCCPGALMIMERFDDK